MTKRIGGRLTLLRPLCIVALSALACEAVMGADFDAARARTPAETASDATSGEGGAKKPAHTNGGSNASQGGAPPGTGGARDGSHGGKAGEPEPDGAGGVSGEDGASAGGDGALGGSPLGGGEAGQTAGAVGVGGATGEGGAAGEGGAIEPCANEVNLVDVELAFALPREIPASTLARGVGVVRGEDGAPRCVAALVSGVIVLTVPDCDLRAGDRVVFNARRLTNGSNAREVELATSGWQIRDPLFDLVGLVAVPRWDEFPQVTMSDRLPLPGEQLRLVSHAGNGFSRTHVIVVDSATFDRAGSKELARLSTVPAFGEDGKLVAFCELDCGQPTCVSMQDLMQRAPLLAQLEAMGGVFWGDSTGDGRDDAVVSTFNGVALRDSASGVLAPARYWLTEPFYGEQRNLLADFTGDGRADLLALGSTSLVRAASELSYGEEAPVPHAIWGAESAVAGDVDADGDADLVALHDDVLWVHRAGPTGIALPEAWGSAIEAGVLALHLSDATGDGRADAVLVRPDRLDVLRSSGSDFGAPERFIEGVVMGPPGWLFGDVTGDGLADAIGTDLTRTAIFVSDGARFVPEEQSWSPMPPIGERGNYVADVTGDGLADVIVHQHGSIALYASTGAGTFNLRQIADDAYYGGL